MCMYRSDSSVHMVYFGQLPELIHGTKISTRKLHREYCLEYTLTREASPGNHIHIYEKIFFDKNWATGKVSIVRKHGITSEEEYYYDDVFLVDELAMISNQVVDNITIFFPESEVVTPVVYDHRDISSFCE